LVGLHAGNRVLYVGVRRPLSLTGDIMKLTSNWREVLKKAWSVRLSALAAVLSFLEAGFWIAGGSLPFQPGTLFVLSGLASGGAFLARLVAQKGVTPDE
jgi:hypothetical protein